jgi:hypothetical protein
VFGLAIKEFDKNAEKFIAAAGALAIKANKHKLALTCC